MDRLHYKFTKQEAKPVTSPLIEVRETYTGPYTTPDPIVKEVDIEHIEDSDVEESEQQKGKIYKNKKEFVDEMTNAYTKELLSRGLDPMFAKYLVAQDGLESNWGKSSLGYHFNYGGIKETRTGKGVAKPTNEFINGKMEKVSGNFREFSSLQDYVKYKVGLLNNNRYRAFSSHPGDFIFHVVGGGYATDPEYVNKFNRHLNSFQNGGILQRRVITPAEVEAKKERTNDIIRDKNILANLVKEDSALLKLFPNSALGNFIANRYIQRINDTAVKVGSKDTTGRSGFIEVDDLNDKSAIKKGTIKLTKDIVEAAIKRRSGDLNKVISELDTIRNKYPNGHELTKEELVNEKSQLTTDSELTKLGMDLGFLLNHLAYNDDIKDSDIVYAKNGIPVMTKDGNFTDRFKPRFAEQLPVDHYNYVELPDKDGYKLHPYGMKDYIDKFTNNHGNKWSMDDVMYFYNRAHDSKFSPEAIVYVTATESSFNPKAKHAKSTAVGLGQLTDARMKQVLGDDYAQARQEYDSGTRSIKDQIDDLMKNVQRIDGNIKDLPDNRGYGRLKVNYLKPSWSIYQPNIKGLNLEANLTKEQRKKINENSSVLELVGVYDEELTNKFKHEGK